MAAPGAGQKRDDALAVFSKYQSSFARRLKKDEAIAMFMKEFNLDEKQADVMFMAFDKDNNDIMSLWEFRQFYQTVGIRAQDTMALYKNLKIDDDSGNIDLEKAFDSLKSVPSPKGPLTEEEIEMFLKTTAGETKEIDFSKFLNMMCRINVYRGPE